MVSLLDIADQHQRTVPVRGKEISVFGLSAKDIVHLFSRFPELRAMMAGKTTDVTAETMIELAPAAVATAIAAGTGSGGDKKAEAVAARLPIGDQVELLGAIFEMTFPQGVGPFVAMLDRLGLRNVPAASGKAADTKSPAPSMNSSQVDTSAPMSG